MSEGSTLRGYCCHLYLLSASAASRRRGPHADASCNNDDRVRPAEETGGGLHLSSPLRFIYQNVNFIPTVGSNSDVLRYENAKPPLTLEYATPA
jgi:hypothetical protein